VPTTSIEEIAKMMTDHGLHIAKREQNIRDPTHVGPNDSGHDQ